MELELILAADPGDLVFLDTETTSLEGEIVEIACLSGTGEVLLETLVVPSTLIPAEATAIHGISSESYPSKSSASYRDMLWKNVYPKVREIITGKTVVAYNAVFDRKMLHRSCEAWGIGPHDDLSSIARWVCLMKAYSQWASLSRRVSLTEASEIDLGSQTHRAMGDCQLSRQLWLRMRSEAPPAKPPPPANPTSMILLRSGPGKFEVVAELPMDAKVDDYLRVLTDRGIEISPTPRMVRELVAGCRSRPELGVLVVLPSPDAWFHLNAWLRLDS